MPWIPLEALHIDRQNEARDMRTARIESPSDSIYTPEQYGFGRDQSANGNEVVDMTRRKAKRRKAGA